MGPISEFKGQFFIYNKIIEDTNKFSELMNFIGNTLYEVIRVIDGIPLFVEEHLLRLDNSAKIVGVFLKYSKDEIIQEIKKLITANSEKNGNIKIIFNYKEGLDSIFALYFIEHKYPKEDIYKIGVDTILFHGERPNPNVKYLNNEFRKKIHKKISAENSFEAILVDNQGFITEGSKSNIFMIRGNNLITAPVQDVLPGVTRERIIRLAESLHIDFFEDKIYYKDIYKMEAVFITGTSPKVLPIRSIDGIKIKSTENKIITKIMFEYDNLIKEYIYSKNRCDFKV